MGGNLTTTLPEFPVKLKLFSITNKASFYDAPEGIKAIREYENGKRNGIIIKIVIWIALIASVYYLFTNGHPIWAIILALFGLGFAIGITFGIQPNDLLLLKKINKHCNEVAEDLINRYFSGSVYFSYKTEALIYNNNICAYLSTKNDELVLYKKENIKEVYREHTYLGSTTTSYSVNTGKSTNKISTALGVNPFMTREYKGNSQISTSTRTQYEWHFDILTDFFEYPKVSFILPDNEYYNNEIGKAYAILKP